MISTSVAVDNPPPVIAYTILADAERHLNLAGDSIRCWRITLRGDLLRAASAATNLDAELVGPPEHHDAHLSGLHSLDEDEQSPGSLIKALPARTADDRAMSAGHGLVAMNALDAIERRSVGHWMHRALRPPGGSASAVRPIVELIPRCPLERC
jgi:hypothetical protein